MSNLLGEPFEPWVTKQIDVRQKSLGKYSTTQIQANLVKTPWIRLASSVNLEFPKGDTNRKNSVPQKLVDAGLNISDFEGVELAKKSILYGGVVSMTGENNSITQNSSINNGKSPFNGAYGWGGIEERGYVPMPGITDVSVQYQNNGALTKTTINIKCFSKRQFQIIDVLYLRPGYSLLLEFGHSTYLNNDEKYDSFENFSSSPLRTLFNPGDKTQYDIYGEIAETRKEYDGNYEAVYGKITTFKWSFNTDGSYECQVTLTGMGDVIESLKMNISVGEDEGDVENKDGKDDDPPLIANKDKSLLNKQLFTLYQSVKVQNITAFSGFRIVGYPNPDNKFVKEDKTFSNNIFSIGDVKTDGDDQSPQAYITFGALLAIIQTKIVLHDNSKGSDVSIPLFRFDMNFNDLAKDDNYILRIPGGFSSNPLTCIIPYSNTISPIPNLQLPQFNTNKILSTSSSWDVENEPYVGRLAGIFVNINYIAQVLDDIPLDEENNINLLDFLKEIIKGITQSLGGVNKINITVTENGLVKFIEEIPQRLSTNDCIEEKEYARFNSFGVKPEIEGSFLTSIDLDAEIPSSFAATLAIGSQGDGNQKSGNSTAFSNYNRGLKDRIIPEKTLSNKRNSKEIFDLLLGRGGLNLLQENLSKLKEEQGDKIIKNFEKILKIKLTKSSSPLQEGATGPPTSAPPPSIWLTIYGDKRWFSEHIDTLTNLNTTHASLILGMLTQPDSEGEQQLQSPFFLPFNLSLEMEGLTGMKLYQKFKISEEILPPSYEKGGVDIQIKGINHTVNNSGWKTKLETQSVPSAKLSQITTSYSLPLGEKAINASNAAVLGGASSSPFTGPTPNADRLRAVLSSLGYVEKGSEISNGGDITSLTADAGVALFKQIKTLYSNLSIKVTGGNDYFHQKLSYNSRHKAGRGLDFVISPSSQTDVNNVVKILQGFAAGSDGNFSYLNEYNNPTKAASGKHFHVSTGKGTEGAGNIQAAKKLAADGKIKTYNIA
jgi:hypothetical protein